jgi:hypothetical protein
MQHCLQLQQVQLQRRNCQAISMHQQQRGASLLLRLSL